MHIYQVIFWIKTKTMDKQVVCLVFAVLTVFLCWSRAALQRGALRPRKPKRRTDRTRWRRKDVVRLRITSTMHDTTTVNPDYN